MIILVFITSLLGLIPTPVSDVIVELLRGIRA